MTDQRQGPTAAHRSSAKWHLSCREAATSADGLYLSVYTRSAVPAFGTRAYCDEVRARVSSLVEDGTVDDWNLEVWGDHLDPDSLSEETDGPSERAGELLAWAERRGLDLAFDERRRRSMLIEGSHDVLVPPHVTVAVRDDESLLGVAPCTDGEQTTTVMDLLTLLENPEPKREDRWTATA